MRTRVVILSEQSLIRNPAVRCVHTDIHSAIAHTRLILPPQTQPLSVRRSSSLHIRISSFLLLRIELNTS